MNLDYAGIISGQPVATETLLNLNIQFHRVRDRQEKVYGWAWSQDDPELSGDCTDGNYDIDSDVVINDLCTALKARLWELADEWDEEHPKAS